MFGPLEAYRSRALVRTTPSDLTTTTSLATAMIHTHTYLPLLTTTAVPTGHFLPVIKKRDRSSILPWGHRISILLYMTLPGQEAVVGMKLATGTAWWHEPERNSGENNEISRDSGDGDDMRVFCIAETTIRSRVKRWEVFSTCGKCDETPSWR